MAWIDSIDRLPPFIENANSPAGDRRNNRPKEFNYIRVLVKRMYIYFFFDLHEEGRDYRCTRTLMRKRGARNLLAEENGRRGRTEERRVIGILL